MRTRICMVLDSDYPEDIRLKKEINSLIDNGFDLYLLCLRFSKKDKRTDRIKNLKVFRIYLPKRFSLIARGLINTSLDFYSYFWAFRIFIVMIKYNIKFLHLHDLYMLKSGIIVKRLLRNKKLSIIGDLHENYVEAIKLYRDNRGSLSKLFLSYNRWKRKELYLLNNADYLLTVIDEAQNRLKKLKVEERKLYLVPNYADTNELDKQTSESKDLRSLYSGTFNVIYLGGINSHRGLYVLINAISILSEKLNTIKCIIIGKGSYKKKIEQIIIHLNIESYVDLIDEIPFSSIRSYISISDICVIPHYKNPHTDTTIPHKLFQFMYFRKPVVVANCKPLRRIVLSSKCGMVYDCINPNELADKILYLKNNENQRITYADNGYNSVINAYNWKISEKSLIRLYSKLRDNETP